MGKYIDQSAQLYAARVTLCRQRAAELRAEADELERLAALFERRAAYLKGEGPAVVLEDEVTTAPQSG